MGGVGAVVSSDHKKHVHGGFVLAVEHSEERVLAFLGGSANGVEDVVGVLIAVAIDDRLPDPALKFLGFALQHGGLVGDADPLEVVIGIKALGIGSGEGLQELLFVASVADVIADLVGIGGGEDDEVMTIFFGSEGTGCGRPGFLVIGLAMNDGGNVVFGVVAHSAPYFHYITTGGVDDVAADLGESVHEMGRGSEGRDNHDILVGELVVIGAHFPPWEGNDSHFAELGVDLRVVDDFANQENTLFFEDLASGVSEVDRAFNAVAEAKFSSQADGGVADGEFATLPEDFFHDGRAVVVLDFVLDEGHDIGAPDIDTFAFLGGWRGGCWVAHGCGWVLSGGGGRSSRAKLSSIGVR